MRRLLLFGRRKPSPERLVQAITWHKATEQPTMSDPSADLAGTAALKRSEYFDGTIGACKAGCWHRCVLIQDARQCPNYTLRAGVASELDTTNQAFLADPDLDIPAKAVLNPQPLPPGRVDPPLNLTVEDMLEPPAKVKPKSLHHSQETLSRATMDLTARVQQAQAQLATAKHSVLQCQENLDDLTFQLADHKDALGVLATLPTDE